MEKDLSLLWQWQFTFRAASNFGFGELPCTTANGNMKPLEIWTGLSFCSFVHVFLEIILVIALPLRLSVVAGKLMLRELHRLKLFNILHVIKRATRTNDNALPNRNAGPMCPLPPSPSSLPLTFSQMNYENSITLFVPRGKRATRTPPRAQRERSSERSASLT